MFQTTVFGSWTLDPMERQNVMAAAAYGRESYSVHGRRSTKMSGRLLNARETLNVSLPGIEKDVGKATQGLRSFLSSQQGDIHPQPYVIISCQEFLVVSSPKRCSVLCNKCLFGYGDHYGVQDGLCFAILLRQLSCMLQVFSNEKAVRKPGSSFSRRGKGLLMETKCGMEAVQ
ncbi:hypothetical protein STEG23_028311 [Scotinomys teguina]